MNQDEIQAALGWALYNLNNCEMRECDESDHVYWKDERIGGHAGDTREFFWDQNDTSAKVLRMMDAMGDEV